MKRLIVNVVGEIAVLLAKMPQYDIQNIKDDDERKLFEIKASEFTEMPILKEPTDYKPVVKRGKGKVKKW